MASLFILPNKDKNYLRYLVWILSWTWIITCAIFVPLGFILIPAAWLRWTFLLLCVTAISVINLLLNRWGYTKIASYALPFMLYLLITWSAITSGGIEAPIVFAYLPVILTTGFLLGGRRGVGMAVLCIFTNLLFVYAQAIHVLPKPALIFSPFNRWVVYLIPLSITIVIQYFATGHIQESLDRISKEMDERKNAETIKDKTMYDMGERVKELKTLYSSSRLFQDEKNPIPVILQQFVSFLPAGWQYPDITAARVTVGTNEFVTSNFVATPYCQRAEKLANNNMAVVIEVVYLEEKPLMDEGVFLTEERQLINMLAEMLKTYLDSREAHEALEKSEANLQTIMKATKVAYMLIDENMKIISVNESSVEFGAKEFGKKATMGDGLSEFFPADKKPELNKIIELVYAGQSVNYESSYPQSDGSFNYYHISMTPIRSAAKEYQGFLLAISNISEIKKAEHEIRRLNESLEEKVQERTKELLQANRELEAFSYMVSHDLQAPLRVINGYGNLLLESQAQKLGEEGVGFLNVINDKADQMSRLIKDLLDFSKFGKAPLNKKEVDMNAVVNAVIAEINLGNQDLKVKIQMHPLPDTSCDATLVKQVWSNLLSNAVKYSSKKEDATVEIGHEERENTRVFYVKDNGAGFDMQHADKLFKVFKRLHSSSDFEGSGVGLATVQRIINKHGGRIWVYAKPNEGATFYFTLS